MEALKLAAKPTLKDEAVRRVRPSGEGLQKGCDRKVQEYLPAWPHGWLYLGWSVVFKSLRGLLQ